MKNQSEHQIIQRFPSLLLLYMCSKQLWIWIWTVVIRINRQQTNSCFHFHDSFQDRISVYIFTETEVLDVLPEWTSIRPHITSVTALEIKKFFFNNEAFGYRSNIKCSSRLCQYHMLEWYGNEHFIGFWWRTFDCNWSLYDGCFGQSS